METRGTSTSNSVGFLSRMALNDNKAGMEGLDRDKINKIIMEASKGSRFYENELKKEQQVNQRIERMMLQKAQITEQQLRKAQAQVEKMTSDLEMSRDLSRVIVHVDMDAFYAAVETKDQPDLKDKPMAVGSMSMLSTSNYHARKFGVRAAMPGFIAKKLCPNLVIVPTNFDKYKAVSTEVREIFADYDPHFLPMSLDEAYLDISEHLEQRRSWPESMRTHPLHTNTMGTGTGEEGHGETVVEEEEGFSPVLFEDSPSSSPALPQASGTGGGDVATAMVFGTCAEEAVREMRFRIEQRTSLTASAGIAPNMMIAKVCSDKNKPNGQYKLLSDTQAVMDFIQDLPVRKVSGIGKVTEKMLGALGITSCAHLGQQMALVSLLFSESSWHHFLQISLGLGSTHIERDGERKSLSIERTFGEMSAVEEQLSLCKELCQDLAKDLKKEGLKGKTVTLKLKNVNFKLKSRAMTLPCAIATEEEIFAVAKDLLKTEVDNVSPQPLRLRLMGVRISTFVNSDDKKPLQKSIVGFLGGPSHQDPSQKYGKEPSLQPPIQNQTHPSSSAYPPLVHETQEPQRQPGDSLPWLPSRSGVELGRSGQEQQSFFQKAHTQRLRLQAKNGDTSSDSAGDEEDPLAIIPSIGTQLWDSSNKTHNNLTSLLTYSDKTATTVSQSVVSIEAHTSLNASAHCSTDKELRSQGLICPVCFQEVRTTYLNVFNRHIDQCLSGVSTMEGNRQTDADTKPHAGMQLERGHSVWEEEVWREREECEERLKDEGKNVVDGEKRKRRRECVVIQEDGGLLRRLTDSNLDVDQSETTTGPSLCETSSTNISTHNSMVRNPVLLDTTLDKGVFVANRRDPHPDRNNLKEHEVLEDSSKGVYHVWVIDDDDDDDITMTSLQPKSHDHEPRGPVLTCPVCQETQDTDDLTLFNQHVDLCLNREVLHKLGGGLAVGGSTTLFTGTAHSREKERDRPLPSAGTANKGKSKRRGSSPPPPSKKAKALGSCNTIDKFFR